MNNSTKITRLNIGSDDSEPFTFLGIASSEPDYTLSLRINKKAGIGLSHSDKEIIPDTENENASFSLFITPDHRHALVSNKTGKKILINKLNKIDFFFISRPDINSNVQDQAKIMRSIEGVTAVFVLSSNEIRDRNIEFIRHLTE